MRKLVLIFVSLVLLVNFVFAEDGSGSSDVKLEALMQPGDFGIYAGVGFGLLWGALDFSGGVETIIGQYDISDTLPITFGVAAKGGIFSYSDNIYGSDYNYTYLGGGAFFTVHLGFTEDSVPDNVSFLANIDWYAGIGPAFYSYSYGYSDSKISSFVFGFSGTGGVNYFLTDNLAINLEGGYYGYYSSGIIGILIKF